jgi:hypothetical protein
MIFKSSSFMRANCNGSWPDAGVPGSISPVTPAGITLLGAARAALRYGSVHTGLPALVVAAIAAVVGYKILKRTARFAVEVTVISVVLAALLDRFAADLGWLHG